MIAAKVYENIDIGRYSCMTQVGTWPSKKGEEDLFVQIKYSLIK